MSVRKTVTDLVETMVNGISTSTGYQTDFDLISVWQTTPFSDDEVSCNIKDLADEIESDDEGVIHTHNLHFEIDLIIGGKGSDAVENGRFAIQDIYTAIRNNFNTDTYKAWPESDDLTPQHDDKLVCNASVRFYIKFVTGAFESTILNTR